MSIVSRFLDRRSLTPNQVWGKALDEWFTNQSASGIDVTIDKALQLPVVRRCVNLLVDDISQLPVDIYQEIGEERIPLPAPSWLLNPTGDPNYGWLEHISDVLWSLCTDGNAFVRCYPNRVNPSALVVLDPSKVQVSGQNEIGRAHV